MDPLDLSILNVTVKLIASRSTLRLITTLKSSISGDVTSEERKRFVEWFETFYEHVRQHQTPFCIIYMFESISNPEDLKFFLDVLKSKRELTRRYSVGTCVVAPPLISLAVNAVVGMYECSGTIHTVETLDEAKQICRQRAQARYAS